jgi:hypothetical protein
MNGLEKKLCHDSLHRKSIMETTVLDASPVVVVVESGEKNQETIRGAGSMGWPIESRPFGWDT